MQTRSIGGDVKMDKLFQSKWFIRVISLLFAIMLYIFVTVETNVNQDDSRIPIGPTTEVQVLDEVPLGIKIEADQYVVSGVPEHVKVTLEGRTSVLTPIIRQLNFNVFVDLRELSEGEHTVEVEYENLPDGVTAYIEPKTIDVVVEKRTAREFSVDIDIVNEDKLPVGYELGLPEVNQETVTLISSEAVIEQVAMVKVFIDVKDVKESIRNRELPISVYDIQGNDLNVRVEPESITVSLPVERPSKKVPLTVVTEGELAKGLAIETMTAAEEIDIFGKRAVLEEVKEVSTLPIDLSEIKESGTYDIELDLPEGVAVNNDTVEVEIEVTKAKSFDDVRIESEAEEELEYTIVEPEDKLITVEAKGLDDVIDKLEKADIKAFVKLSNLTAGTHKIDLVVEGPDGITFKPEAETVTVTVD